MNTSLHRSSTRAGLLVASALFCSLPGLLSAEEALSTTAQQFDETVQHDDSVSAATRISARFTTLAGSSQNATALVTGLHDGTAVTLTTTAANGTVTKTVFQPATGKLGYGNTFISLALAQESLAKAGITAPTSAQLVAALNGGSVTGSSGTAVTLPGVLTLRAAGQGWGDIAQTLNVKLGRVVSDLHVANHEMEKPEQPKMKETAVRAESAAKTGQAAAGPQTAARSESSGRPDWAGHSSLPNPGHMPRPGRP
ncbi:hypothetical protein [Opitutus sp. GAS368]|uniref:hypothetical protein n=1 Tax=Opitutus sp. GAS368 TaxID=1882749 RepID=UPI00087CA100|nr:hypothetical protein [Opitutus sp. GAS368]SDS21368.1 hypothetical protein SAMN05444173_2217 [Opitutus sp. GAS368]